MIIPEFALNTTLREPAKDWRAEYPPDQTNAIRSRDHRQ
jgi:hypothetical protein